MAEKKTTAKKAAPKKTEKMTAVKGKNLDELRINYRIARQSHSAGELVNPRVLGSYRKEIARQLTAVNAKKEKK